MITYSTPKMAHEAGLKIFTSDKECKYGHTRCQRRVIFQNGSYTSKCLDCEKGARFKYSENPEKMQFIIETKRKWKNKNKDRQNRWRERYKETRPFKHQLANIRAKCYKNNIPFDLDEEYLESIIPEGYICPITGTKMVHGHSDPERNKKNWISIDKIEPSKGYVKGNVALISYYANLLKSNCVNPDIFRKIADYIELNHIS